MWTDPVDVKFIKTRVDDWGPYKYHGHYFVKLVEIGDGVSAWCG